MYINPNSAPSVLQLANDTLGKMYNRYIELKLAGGAYEYLEQSIILIYNYTETCTHNYQELSASDTTYQEMINNLYNLITLQEYTAFTYGSPIDEGFIYTTNQTSNLFNGFTSVTTYTPNRFIISNKYGYPVASEIDPSIFAEGTLRQTSVVFPAEGAMTYTFSELIGKQVYSVYRGASTVLRSRSTSPSDIFVQFNIATGQLTFSYGFNTDESLWVQYKSTT